jgi:hypothetical protein
MTEIFINIRKNELELLLENNEKFNKHRKQMNKLINNYYHRHKDEAEFKQKKRDYNLKWYNNTRKTEEPKRPRGRPKKVIINNSSSDETSSEEDEDQQLQI